MRNYGEVVFFALVVLIILVIFLLAYTAEVFSDDGQKMKVFDKYFTTFLLKENTIEGSYNKTLKALEYRKKFNKER